MSRRSFAASRSVFLAARFCAILALLPFVLFMQVSVHAQEVCPRPASGAVVDAPPELDSVNGTLEVTMNFRSMVDAAGLTRYCYVTDAGRLSPTLRVHPGDTLKIHLKNDLPPSSSNMPVMDMGSSTDSNDPCNAAMMTDASTNLHFHGLNISPTCHQDEVIHTLVQPGETFDYTIPIPANEPPGLYWYHPHAHGLSDIQVNGGATGAIIVEGLQEAAPALTSLTERTFVLRDQEIPDANQNPNDANEPSWDVSVNYVPILYPNYQPAVIQTNENAQELWRVVNSAADTIFNLQLVVDGTPQAIQIYAVDGVPVNSGPISTTILFLPPGDRAEFVVKTPQSGHTAQWITTRWDAGPAGDSAPPRPIANIVPLSPSATSQKVANGEWRKMPNAFTAPAKFPKSPPRFSGLADATPTTERTLFFYEEGDESPTATPTFFITVDGQDPEVFSPTQAPNIITHSGSVEDWTIQNRSTEDHIFHIHQIHFQVLEVNGVAVQDPAIRDTMRVDHYIGSGPYPSIKVRMDFRDPTLIGTFVYHCHILDHEDHGMMGQILLLPPALATSLTLSAAPAAPAANTDVAVTATITPAAGSGPDATGFIVFNVDGSSVAYPQRINNGAAVFHTSFTTYGNHVITASYNGDNAYLASNASPLTVPVPSPAFKLSATSTALTISENTASASITSTAIGGFTSPIAFTCTLPAALKEATCSMSPATISAAGQTVLTVKTTSAHSLSAQNRSLRILLFAGGLLPVFLFGISMRRSRPRFYLCCIATGSLALLLWTGCGGGGGSKQQASAPGDPGTPSGIYTVVVTGTSGQGTSALTDSISFQLTVKE